MKSQTWTPNIQLHNIDCMDFMKTCDDNQFKLAICDPPYFSGPEKRKYYGRKYSAHGVKRKNYKPLEKSLEVPTIEYYNELVRVSEHQIIWGINYFEFVNQVGPARIIWDKVNENSTFSHCEIASCSLHKNKVSIFRFMWRGMMQGSADDGTKMNGDKSKNEKRIHTTQKPVKLYKWLLKHYGYVERVAGFKTKDDINILDTHLGSGSIAIACHDMGFDLTACELDASTFNDAKNRLEEHKKQLTIFKP